MKKNKFIGAALTVFMLLAAGNLSAINMKKSFKKTQFTLRGGLNMFNAVGSESDYVAGTNDFPVTPAYNAAVCGIGLIFFTSPSFAIGFDVRYGLAAKVDMRDPSDGEIINVDTPKNLVASLNLYQYFNLSRQMKLFISLGGGGEYRMANDADYTGSLGSEIHFLAPAKAFSPLAVAGTGFNYMFSDSLGLSLELQGAYIFRTPAQMLISPSLGINLKF